jgi:hypothetical protein
MPLKYRYYTFFVALTKKCPKRGTTWKRIYPNIGGSLRRHSESTSLEFLRDHPFGDIADRLFSKRNVRLIRVGRFLQITEQK